MSARQDSDNLAWDRSDEVFEEAEKYVSLPSTCRKIESFAEKLFSKPATVIGDRVIVGGFNALYLILLQGASDTFLIRLPLPNQALFPEEKTLAEAATARCISQMTQLPVPEVSQHGVDPDIGPFIVLEYVRAAKANMSRVMEKPRDDPSDAPVLCPDILESKLQDLYEKMARCMLHLSEPTFPHIGALVEQESNPPSFHVQGRPITLNMTNMVQLSNIPVSIFPEKGTTYNTADGWYTLLAEMQMATLVFQHNDMVSTEDDARTKYVARQLFRRLAKEGKLARFGFLEDDWSAGSKTSPATLSMPDGTGSFRLWSDDFRPVNILMDKDDEVLAAIDWEFTYAAPTQFSLDSPWWLLLEAPEMWDDGIEDWSKIYDERLKTWLSAMEAVERDSATTESLRLSEYMRESWATGRFWLNYAARKSWAFDAVYWKYLDERFFGERARGRGDDDIPPEKLWETRVDLLTREERAMMEPLVQMKMEEAKDKVLVEWDADEARQRLSLFLC